MLMNSRTRTRWDEHVAPPGPLRNEDDTVDQRLQGFNTSEAGCGSRSVSRVVDPPVAEWWRISSEIQGHSAISLHPRLVVPRSAIAGTCCGCQTAMRRLWEAARDDRRRLMLG